MSSEALPHLSCIDAETLAAWSDGALPGAEAAQVELHLSNCARCQAMLAVFARSEPVVRAIPPVRQRAWMGWLVPLAGAAAVVVIWVSIARRERPASPEQIARADIPAAGRADRAASGVSTLAPASQDAHLGPPAAAPAAASQPSITRRHEAAPKSVEPNTATSSAEKSRAVEGAMPLPPAPAPALPAAPVRSPERRAEPPQSTSTLTGRVTDSAGGAIPGATIRVTKGGSVLAPAITDSSGRYRVAGLAPGPYDIIVALPGFHTVSRSGVEAASGAETVVNATLQVAGVSETVQAAARAPAIQAATGERSSAITASQAADAATFRASAPAALAPTIVEIVAPSPAGFGGPAAAGGVAGGLGGGGGGGRGGRGGGLNQAAASPAAPPTRWRIVRSGAAYGNVMADSAAPVDAAVGRSTDGGATWQALSIDRSVIVTSGVAPSNSVCWLVGAKGLVLLSTDGLRFERRPIPEPVDVISIRATNAREATVTTADRRTFSTVDGGITWVQGFELPPF